MWVKTTPAWFGFVPLNDMQHLPLPLLKSGTFFYKMHSKGFQREKIIMKEKNEHFENVRKIFVYFIEKCIQKRQYLARNTGP